MYHNIFADCESLMLYIDLNKKEIAQKTENEDF